MARDSARYRDHAAAERGLLSVLGIEAALSRRLQDIRVAVRTFRRNPGFAFAAILALGLGIGLSTAVFTVANAVLLRRLAVRDQDRLVVLWGESRDGRFSNWPVSPRMARDFAAASHTVRSVAAFGYWGSTATSVERGDRVLSLNVAVVSGNFFSVLGTRALIGRTLDSADDVAGAAPVAVVSYEAWNRQFGADPAVLGRPLVLATGQRFNVVGVMPEGVDYPRGSEFWTPITSAFGTDADSLAEVDIVGRLAAHASAQAAATELTGFFRASPFPNTRVLRGVAHTLPELITGDVRPAIDVFAAAVLLLLIITCTNVANLLLVRGLGRDGEMTVRAALGASRGRLVAQLFTENTLLAGCGGAVGVVVAWSSTRAFVTLAPAGLPRLSEIRLDPAALAGAAVITMVATLCSGLAPAFVTTRLDLQRRLRSSAWGGARPADSRGDRNARRGSTRSRARGVVHRDSRRPVPQGAGDEPPRLRPAARRRCGAHPAGRRV